MLAPLLGLVAMTGMLTITTIKRFKKSRDTTQKSEDVTNIDGKHRGDQGEVLAYLCGLNNLGDEADNLVMQSGKTSYWAQADRLAAKGVTAKKEDALKYKSVLKGLLDYAKLNGTSEGIVCYDIARIASAHGEVDEARNFLDLAKPKMGKLLETRLKLDQGLKNFKPPG